jgi:hypothetical protein
MLDLAPTDERYALRKAAEARESAEAAKDPADRHFWLSMEAKWTSIAGTSAFLERINTLYRSIEARH